jgi:uncharacterized OB-fold protein
MATARSVMDDLKVPELYARDDNRVVLLGVSCATCGHLGFPRQAYGCEKCGAYGDDLTDVEITTTGRLQSFATVFRHPSKSITPPFIIGEVRLDAGLMVRATMIETDDGELEVGASVIGTLHGSPAELRFTLED